MKEVTNFIKAIELFELHQVLNNGKDCCFGIAKCSFEILKFLFELPYRNLSSE